MLQSNKKEKGAAPTETKSTKKPEVKPVTVESSENPKLSSTQPQLQPQPQPPSSPAQSESKRYSGKAERGVKRGLKNKPACDKVTTDPIGITPVEGPSTTSKPVSIMTGEKQPQEPSVKRTTARLPKSTKRAMSPTDRDTDSVKSDGKAPPTHLPAGQNPQTQHKDNGAERLDNDQEQKPGVVASAAASHTSKAQVRIIVTLRYTPTRLPSFYVKLYLLIFKVCTENMTNMLFHLCCHKAYFPKT